MRTRRSGLALALAVAAVTALYGPSSPARAGVPDENAPYCEQENPAADPADLPQPGSDRPRPTGVTVSDDELDVHGIRTRVLQAGPEHAREAVVFLHGNLGSGYDWVPLIQGVSSETGMRSLALDVPGWGHATKSRERRYTLDLMAWYLTEALEQLRVQRVYLVLHDLSGPWAINWVIANQDRVAGVVLMNTGIGKGYDWHLGGKAWRTPLGGEAFMAALTKPAMQSILQYGQYKPLPASFVDRVYADFGRHTRCAILDAYRSIGDVSALGAWQESQLSAVKPRALVLWGKHDPYIPVEFAHRQGQAFDVAKVVVLEESAHWPFIDQPDEVKTEIICFLARQPERCASTS